VFTQLDKDPAIVASGEVRAIAALPHGHQPDDPVVVVDRSVQIRNLESNRSQRRRVRQPECCHDSVPGLPCERVFGECRRVIRAGKNGALRETASRFGHLASKPALEQFGHLEAGGSERAKSSY